MPEYADELQALAGNLGLRGALTFLGDRPDVPRLLAGMDALCWLSRDEGMPHIISEAGAAGLPVVATRDNGSEQQITEGETGLFVPHECPAAAAAALRTLLADEPLRCRLGASLRAKVEREYAAPAVARRWESLFDEVIAEGAY
jgi:glycosyltransferase involved in cell wall biosynthesis